MELPLIGGSNLPLHLVNFGHVGTLEAELDAFADLTDGFDGDGEGLTLKDVENLTDGPSALVTVAELVGLTSPTWAQDLPPMPGLRSSIATFIGKCPAELVRTTPC